MFFYVVWLCPVHFIYLVPVWLGQEQWTSQLDPIAPVPPLDTWISPLVWTHWHFWFIWLGSPLFGLGWLVGWLVGRQAWVTQVVGRYLPRHCACVLTGGGDSEQVFWWRVTVFLTFPQLPNNSLSDHWACFPFAIPRKFNYVCSKQWVEVSNPCYVSDDILIITVMVVKLLPISFPTVSIPILFRHDDDDPNIDRRVYEWWSDPNSGLSEVTFPVSVSLIVSFSDISLIHSFISFIIITSNIIPETWNHWNPIINWYY